MDLRQLAALVAVADEGSFSAAARSLHTVQSNVSTHIARLERELGAVLVDRTRGTLTDEDVVVVDATTTSLLPQLAAETLDMAVVNLPIDDPELDTEKLLDEDRVLLVPGDHALAARERIDVLQLSQYPLLLEPQGTPFRDELDREAARAGVALRAQAEVDGIRLL